MEFPRYNTIAMIAMNVQAKIRVLKLLWFAIPLAVNITNGNLWRDPLPTALSLLIVWMLGLIAYYAIRFVFFRGPSRESLGRQVRGQSRNRPPLELQS